MKVKNGMCSSCMGIFGVYHEFFACELTPIQCNKDKEEAYLCENMECKFMYREDEFNECDKFIFCEGCMTDPQKVKMTIADYIELFGKEDYPFPNIKY